MSNVEGWGLRYRSGAWEERLVRGYLVTHAMMLIVIGLVDYAAIITGRWPFRVPDLVVPLLIALIPGVLVGLWDGKRIERRAQTSPIVARVRSSGEALFPIVLILLAISAALPGGNPPAVGGNGQTLAALYAGFLVGVPLGISRYEGSRRIALWIRDHAPATALRRAKVSYFVEPA